jgi:ligand-binding SRPBCC domain-containing protein
MIRFKEHSGIYTLEARQFVQVPLDEAWEFFSSPKNLSKITPSKMGFEITSGPADRMYAGQIITYRVGLLPGVKSNWVTEITHVEEEKFFVDEQRYGPYSMWHHEHHFEAVDDGTLMYDKVSYKVPLGFLGRIANKLFIKRQLEAIFSYRFKVLEKMYNIKNYDQERVL